MSRVLPADPLSTDGFDGVRLRAEEVADVDLTGLRVGVLAQTPHHVRLLPQVVQRAARTKLFVTRPVEVLPTTPIGELVHRVGPAARVVAAVHRWRSITEPELRRKVTPLGPDVPRVRSPDYLRTVQHPRCEVVAWPVAAVVAAGVRTADGIEHHLDVLITC